MAHIRSAYSKEPGEPIIFTEPSMTKQSFKASCDINNILVKYQKTGVFDHVKTYQGQYFDATETDYHEAMNTIINADNMFADLPSKARDYFDNDPAKFLAFFDEYSDEAVDKLYDLGLAVGTRTGSTRLPTDDRPTPNPDNPE